MVELLFNIVLVLFGLVDKVGVCFGAVASIGTATSDTISTLKESIKWVKLVTYMVKTATKMFFSPNFWSDPSKISFLGKMMKDVRNHSYEVDKLKEISFTHSKDAVSKTIGTQGCLDLDVLVPPVMAIGEAIPLVVKPLLSIFSFLTPILGGASPSPPSKAAPGGFAVDDNALNSKYNKLKNEPINLGGMGKSDKDSLSKCPRIL